MGPTTVRKRALDRRFWVRAYAALACLGVLLVVLADSWAERIAWALLSVLWAAHAVARARAIKERGRWIEEPSGPALAGLRRRRRILAAAVPVLFVAGLVVGLR